MKAKKTRYEKIKQSIARLEATLHQLARDMERQQVELDEYVRRHRSLSFDGLETGDVGKLSRMYAYFDKKYPVQWQGGLRGDNRGMRLFFWVDDDPDHLILHLTSTSKNICFGGSTSWRVEAPTLADKVKVLAQIKKDIRKIIKGD